MPPHQHRISQLLRWSASSIAVGENTNGSSFRSLAQRRLPRSTMCKRDGITTEASIFGVGAPEAFVIGVVALLVFGPKGLAEAARGLGQTLKAFQPTIRELQEVSTEFKNTLESEIGLEEMKKELRTPVPKPAPIPPKLGTEDDIVTEEMKAQAAKAAWSGDAEGATPAADAASSVSPSTPTTPTAPTTPATPTTTVSPAAAASPAAAVSPSAAAASAASAAAAAAAAAATAATVVPPAEAPSTTSTTSPTPVASTASPVPEPPLAQAPAPPKADADSPPQGVPAAADRGNDKSA